MRSLPPSGTNAAILVILVLILTGTVANLIIALRPTPALNLSAIAGACRPAPACPAIPIKFIFEDPQCADKLLLSMNITNVRILSANSTEAGMLRHSNHGVLNTPRE